MEKIAKMLVILMLIGCGTNSIYEDKSADQNSSIKKDNIFEVKTIPAKQEVLVYPIQTQGKIEANRFVPVIFQTSGILSKVLVSNASYIRQGQLLAVLENSMETIELEDAQVNYQKAFSEYENKLAEYGDSLNYKKNWPRIKEKVGLLVGLPNAKIALDRAQLNLNLTEFRAPFSGIIEGFELREGSSVAAMSPLGRLVDPNSLEVVSEVLEFDMGSLGIGDSASIYPLAYVGTEEVAVVREINPKVELNGYVKVRLAFTSQHNLLEGMSTRVEIHVPDSRQLLVPKTAIVKKSGKDVIFTVQQSVAKWNYVTLGKDNGKRVEVLQGLEPNDQVIISNNLQLAHDTPVKVVPESIAP